MTYPTDTILSVLLHSPVASVVNGQPILASGDDLTAAQQRAIAPLIEQGVPTWSNDQEYADAVQFEARRRTDVQFPARQRELLQSRALASMAEELQAVRAGNPVTAAFAETLGYISLVRAAEAIEIAALAIAELTGPARPADYLSLVAAFDSQLA
ncbi:hypothetical protein ACWPKS_15980 [Coraliomargarita sp. W4R72]